MHIPRKGPNATPLFMIYGYPLSWATLLSIVPYLTNRAAHGGKAGDSFTLIIPSLCVFCLSNRSRAAASGFRTILRFTGQSCTTAGKSVMGSMGTIRAGSSSSPGTTSSRRI